MMKKALLPLAIAAVLPMSALADVTVYGKANVSVQMEDENGDSSTDVNSNASRLGVKGSEELTEGLKAIYKFEFEVQVDDGDKDGETFSQRNIYVGLQGGFGTVIAGKFDTPLKVAQKKIDLFNDLEGDIKSLITNSDNRASNSVMYSTPKLFNHVKASIDYIASEKDGVDDGVSTSISWSNKQFYVAAAFDQDVEAEGTDTYRVASQWKLGNLQLGALYEEEEPESGDSEDGWVVSAAYKIDKVTLKAQYGESDMKSEGGETFSLGADYKLSKNTKLFAYLTDEEADNGLDKEYAGVGIELKF